MGMPPGGDFDTDDDVSCLSRSTEWPGAPERGRPPGPEPVQLGQARGLHLD